MEFQSVITKMRIFYCLFENKTVIIMIYPGIQAGVGNKTISMYFQYATMALYGDITVGAFPFYKENSYDE